ncbi:reverse transcriptase [Gossypium australe]|uniref:Reverse transcriptase n=1 Tax=Gossypium australe TaxID=47621 RepID=A0A5B6VUG5_9ROSI|nr:reverse transcriptase [Gossypium australe]
MMKCWPVIGEDVTSFCLHFLNGGMDVSLINKTNIVLIPKITNPSNITHFRPISLCNVLYKLMAKVIANCFREVLGKCIDLTQSDNVLLAYEILHTLKHKKVGENELMAVKLDMSKAYDRVEWNFVKEMMKRMGFDPGWVDSLIKCVSIVSYSVVFNGHIGKKIRPTRGLRHGGPLSLFLFLICGEGLSSLLRLAIKENLLRGVKASRRGPQVLHLLFADDCVLFREATGR